MSRAAPGTACAPVFSPSDPEYLVSAALARYAWVPMRWGPSFLAGGVLLGAAGGASAEPAAGSGPESPVHVQLSWERPGDECLTESELKRLVEAKLGRAVFSSEGAPDLVLRGELRGDNGLWVAELRLQGPEGQGLGTRRLEQAGEHCDVLDEMLSLVVALLVDVPRDELPAKSAPPEPPTKPPPKPVQKPEAPAPKRPPLKRPPRWQAYVQGVVGQGFTPEAGLGLRAGGRLLLGGWAALDLGGGLWQEAETRQVGHGAALRGSWLGLAFCPWLALENRLALCGALEARRLAVSGFGFEQNQSVADLGFGAGLDVSWVQPIVTPIVLRADALFRTPLSRSRLIFQSEGGVQELHDPSPLAFGLAVGLGVAF